MADYPYILGKDEVTIKVEGVRVAINEHATTGELKDLADIPDEERAIYEDDDYIHEIPDDDPVLDHVPKYTSIYFQPPARPGEVVGTIVSPEEVDDPPAWLNGLE